MEPSEVRLSVDARSRVHKLAVGGSYSAEDAYGVERWAGDLKRALVRRGRVERILSEAFVITRGASFLLHGPGIFELIEIAKIVREDSKIINQKPYEGSL